MRAARLWIVLALLLPGRLRSKPGSHWHRHPNQQEVFMGHIHATLEAFQVPPTERDEVVALMQSTKKDMVEA